MNGTTVPMTEADVLALAPDWADVEKSDVAIENDHPYMNNVLWVANGQIESEGVLVNVCRLDILQGPDASIGTVAIQAFVEDDQYGEGEMKISSPTTARRLAAALMKAADQLDVINAEDQGLRTFDIPWVSNLTPSENVWLILKDTGADGSERHAAHPLESHQTQVNIGDKWDSNRDESKRYQTVPPEHSYEAIALARRIVQRDDETNSSLFVELER